MFKSGSDIQRKIYDTSQQSLPKVSLVIAGDLVQNGQTSVNRFAVVSLI